ncbi:MAG: hypothetical protein Q9200_004622 [Gallowayella weberi]
MAATTHTPLTVLGLSLFFLATQLHAITAKPESNMFGRSDGAPTSVHHLQKTISVIPVPAVTPGEISNPGSTSFRPSTQSAQQAVPLPINPSKPEKSTPAESKSAPTIGDLSTTHFGQQPVATTPVLALPDRPSSQGSSFTLSTSISGQTTTTSKSSRPTQSVSQKSSTLPVGALLPAPTRTSGLMPHGANSQPSQKSIAAPTPTQAPQGGPPTLSTTSASTADAIHAFNGIIMPGLLTLPGPSLADSWKDTGGYGASLDAALGDAFEMTQMTERFPPATQASLIEIQKQNRNLFTQLKDNLSDISQCITKPAVCFEVVTKRKQAFAIGGLVLFSFAQQGVTSLAALPKPIHPMLGSNSTETTKKPDNQYFIVTVEGTTIEIYQKFIQSLPDRGSGRQRRCDWPRTYQTYLAQMKEGEAQEENGNRIVDMIGPHRIKMYRHSYQVHATEFDRGDHLKTEIHSNGNVPLSKHGQPGAAVAALAIGKYSGVASQPAFTAVKEQSSSDGNETTEGYANRAFDAWHWVVTDVRAK